jgi:hypothetical protein
MPEETVLRWSRREVNIPMWYKVRILKEKVNKKRVFGKNIEKNRKN